MLSRKQPGYLVVSNTDEVDGMVSPVKDRGQLVISNTDKGGGMKKEVFLFIFHFRDFIGCDHMVGSHDDREHTTNTILLNSRGSVEYCESRIVCCVYSFIICRLLNALLHNQATKESRIYLGVSTLYKS